MEYKYTAEFDSTDSVARDTLVFSFNWSVSSFDLIGNRFLLNWELAARQKNANNNVNGISNMRFNNFGVFVPYGSNTYIKANVNSGSVSSDGENSPIDSGSIWIQLGKKYGKISVSLDFTLQGYLNIGGGTSSRSRSWYLFTTFDITAPVPAIVPIQASDFTDEQNLTITYQKNVSLSLKDITKVEVSVGELPFRQINVLDNNKQQTYVYVFTNEEIAQLRGNATKSVNVVRVSIKTTRTDRTVVTNYVDTNFTIVGGFPILNPSISDVNAATVALTGNSSKFVRYASTAQFTTGAAGTKNATIVSQYVVNGSQTIENLGTGQIPNVEESTFYFGATDSRANSVATSVAVDLVPYSRLSCYFTKATLTAGGILEFAVSGNYFAGNFGAAANSLTLAFKFGNNDWESIVPQIDSENNSFTATHSIPNLDYKGRYSLLVKASDKIAEVRTDEKTVTAIPVFDWGAENFRHNTDVLLAAQTKIMDSQGMNAVSFANQMILLGDSAGETQINGSTINLVGNSVKINGTPLAAEPQTLWQGESAMDGAQSILLSAPVSEQTNGIVIVIAVGGALHSYFVSKKLVELEPNTLHAFDSMKLYIKDSIVLGHEENTGTSTLKYIFSA